MAVSPIWERYYRETPLEKVPWYYTQADYFFNLLDSGKLGKGKALDLGCGLGAKSIVLAKEGFKVTGIDISSTAIRCAKENAKKERVNIKFIAADATNLSFLASEKFDFVLDWANLHGIPKSKRGKYINQIIKHTEKGSKLLLRCFSKREIEKDFAISPLGKIYLFSRKDIKKHFKKYFKILETNSSKPLSGNPPGKWSDEYLMERM